MRGFQNELDAFLKDDRVWEAMELLRVSDDLLDIIEPLENQHSDILAWLLDPREGHRQGDAPLKDLLLSAAEREHRFRNKLFFEYWTPARLRAASFGSAFVTREAILPGKQRLDLLVVDPTNKILLVVENKAGTKLRSSQAEAYYDKVRDLEVRLFPDFWVAFVAIDHDLEDDDEGDDDEQSTKWAYLGYTWLAASAKRAQLRASRGDLTTRLVEAYCGRHTTEPTARERSVRELLAGLVTSHPSVWRRLRAEANAPLIEQTARVFTNDDGGSLWVFARRHRDFCRRFAETGPLAHLELTIQGAMELRPDNLDVYRRKMYFAREAWQKLAPAAEFWPLCIRVSPSAEEPTTAELSVLVYVEGLSTELRSWLLPELARAFPSTGGKMGRVWRTLARAERSGDAVPALAKEWSGVLDGVVRQAP